MGRSRSPARKEYDPKPISAAHSERLTNDEEMTMTWWKWLVAFSLLNCFSWLFLWLHCVSETASFRTHMQLSLVYTLVCAFRSVFPRVDLERLVLFDSPFSSVFLGRSAATIAEISFAIQVSMVWTRVGQLTGVEFLELIAPWIVGSLSIAQLFCWYSIYSRDFRGHVLEESTWALTFAVLSASLGYALAVGKALAAELTVILTAACVGMLVYVAFMVYVDIPMYLSRSRKPVYLRRLGIFEGLADTIFTRYASKKWIIWKPEAAWMTPYFTLAVWLSQAMAFSANVL